MSVTYLSVERWTGTATYYFSPRGEHLGINTPPVHILSHTIHPATRQPSHLQDYRVALLAPSIVISAEDTPFDALRQYNTFKILMQTKNWRSFRGHTLSIWCVALFGQTWEWNIPTGDRRWSHYTACFKVQGAKVSAANLLCKVLTTSWIVEWLARCVAHTHPNLGKVYFLTHTVKQPWPP